MANPEVPKPKIVLVGPTLPFRGGIAHYNTLLFRALRENGLSSTGYSFSRQYPRWLYPGQSDLDPSYDGFKEPGIDYIIDSVNPWTWWRTARKIAAKSPDLVVFHWWTVFMLPCFWIMMFVLRQHGIKTALICHNLADHDAAGLKAAASRRMLAQPDAYLVHSSEHAAILAEEHPGKPLVRHPLPVYGHYPAAQGALPRRGRLELLFFGFIRPYKGLDLLIDALSSLNDPQVFLTVVGEPWGDTAALLRHAQTAPNVELHLSYASDEQASEYFARADLVVLPYRAATGSAVASLAIGYGKPILATRTGGLPDVVIEDLNGFLVPPNDSAALASAIGSISREQLVAMEAGTRSVRNDLSWSSLASGMSQLALRTKENPSHV